ncbi:MAG: hydrogenase maturation protein [Ectothiorhodospiraceae bacterium]|jgi:putative two-component system hydrogenase maturation factor HypX/HoxX|nr:hydrogenase maturation protein [Ectothiorhodospiraceae bacterium]
MRILLLTHAFNSLTQRLYVELLRCGHVLSVEFDVNDAVTEEAVALFRPQLVIAPFLKRAIPESVWRNTLCWIVHPGPRGDRGPSALDWAILDGETHWGVTLLQAEAEMDAGPVWATREFPLRAAAKGSLYRREVTDAAVACVLEALERLADPGFRPEPLAENPGRGRLRPAMRQADRTIDWSRDDTASVLRKIRSADGVPGLRDRIEGRELYLYDAHPEGTLTGTPGGMIAHDGHAICRATLDGAVWIGHMRERGEDLPHDLAGLKLPAVQVLGDVLRGVPERSGDRREIRYEEVDGVGWLYFDFYNGAMSSERCRRLLAAWREALRRDTRVLVLAGGGDFWSNGLHLHVIESNADPAEASWDNIQAMDDLCETIIETRDRLTVAAMSGNAGAGGVFLALAADLVWAAPGVVLNPHYKNMGNLYGSEYWTYLLPRRVGDQTGDIMANRLPLGAPEARAAGLIDDCFGADRDDFLHQAQERAAALVQDPDYAARLADKRARRERDERERPLARYREDELSHMQLNFYGFDPSYHVARYNFVYRVAHSRTPLHLALHRRKGWRPPDDEVAVS